MGGYLREVFGNSGRAFMRIQKTFFHSLRVTKKATRLLARVQSEVDHIFLTND